MYQAPKPQNANNILKILNFGLILLIGICLCGINNVEYFTPKSNIYIFILILALTIGFLFNFKSKIKKILNFKNGFQHSHSLYKKDYSKSLIQ